MTSDEQIRLTRLGVKAVVFYALILVAFYASPYTNLFFLMLSFLSVFGALGAWWTRSNLKGLAAECVSIEPAPAGCGHDVHYVLNAGGRARFNVSMTLKTADRWHTVDTAAIVGKSISRHGLLPGLPRGVHQIQAAWLESRFPFGLLRARRRVETPESAIAYPPPASFPGDPESSLSDLIGQQHVLAADLSPSGLREYRPGDPLHSIHWKASARKLDLVVVELGGEGKNALEVVFDRRCDPEEFDKALSVLTALALLAVREARPVTIQSQGLSATYGSGYCPIRDCLEWLAEVQPLPSGSAPPPPTSPAVIRLPAPRSAVEVSRA